MRAPRHQPACSEGQSLFGHTDPQGLSGAMGYPVYDAFQLRMSKTPHQERMIPLLKTWKPSPLKQMNFQTWG